MDQLHKIYERDTRHPFIEDVRPSEIPVINPSMWATPLIFDSLPLPAKQIGEIEANSLFVCTPNVFRSTATSNLDIIEDPR